MRNDDEIAPDVAAMLADLNAACDAFERGEPGAAKLTVRTVEVRPETEEYRPADVKAVRDGLRASQPLFAQFLGVSAATLRSWEHGTRPVPRIARRFLDEIKRNPAMWTRSLRGAKSTTQVEASRVAASKPAAPGKARKRSKAGEASPEGKG